MCKLSSPSTRPKTLTNNVSVCVLTGGAQLPAVPGLRRRHAPRGRRQRGAAALRRLPPAPLLRGPDGSAAQHRGRGRARWDTGTDTCGLTVPILPDRPGTDAVRPTIKSAVLAVVGGCAVNLEHMPCQTTSSSPDRWPQGCAVSVCPLRRSVTVKKLHCQVIYPV